ncbi:hypothetical protein PWT90_08777 [Aphanocladium album]|nr:hypothetical protein PWT90_08777 [Aphanocladium album]
MDAPQLDKANVPGVPNYPPKQMRIWALTVASVMSFLAFVSISIRLISRRIRAQPLWWDDYMIMFSMVWNWVVVAVALAMYAKGAGYHSSTIGPANVAIIKEYLLVTEVIYIWHMAWTKLSVLLMYYRVFHVPQFKRLVVAVGCFVFVWVITATFLFIFICVPTQKLWKPELPGHCISEMGVWVANGSSTILSDVAILLLPIPQIWKLNTGRSEKIGLTLVFGLGFFTVFTSSFRLAVLFNYRKSDVSYTLFPLLVWTDVEMCAAVISANLPTFRPCLRVFASKLGFTRFSYATATVSGDGSGKMNNTIGSGSTNPRPLSLTAASVRRSVGHVFGAGRLPQDADMHGIMDEEHGYSPGEWAPGEGKGTSLSASAEVDTDREGSIALQSMHKVSSSK